MAAKLKKGDKVTVLTGKDKGKEGVITSIDPKAGKALVDGVNMAIRHTKQTQTSQGGRIPKAMPIQLAIWQFLTKMAKRLALASKLKVTRRSVTPRPRGT